MDGHNLVLKHAVIRLRSSTLISHWNYLECFLEILSSEPSIRDSSLSDLVCNYGLLEKTNLLHVNWDPTTEHTVR